jgi:sulfur-carrier protein
MPRVRFHYWAGARSAAGVESEDFDAVSIAAAVDSATERHVGGRLPAVLKVSTLLVDGRALHPRDRAAELTGEVLVEVLPPYAGG